MTEVDYLIAGQGLAGTCFAWRAHQHGKRVLLVDPSPERNASRVAAGIINPILGPRLNLQWRFEELWSVAEPFYRALEQTLGLRLLHRVPLVRFFADSQQGERWRRKRDSEAYRRYWQPAPPYGEKAFACSPSGWLDTTAFLQASAHRLPLLKDDVHPDDLTPELDRVRWKGVNARYVVFCQGASITANPLFSFLPIRPAKGDILTLHLPNLNEERILNCGKWLLPLGGGLFRAGSTYEWNPADSTPSPDAVEEISNGLAPLLPELPSHSVRDHQAGLRPMLHQGRPILGCHPEHPRLAVLNALGAKGVLQAPFFSGQLLDHLEHGVPLAAEVNLSKFWSS